ncbi:MAG TPA: hypothetical protein PKV48_00320 [Thermodesulfobacteriota bacterium]|nr:hypothetical protein [Thermodesulfobacteriota bacterium]
MATVKQLALRIKYAKTSLNSLTKKLNAGKTKLKVLEADLKRAKAAAGKKKSAKKKAKKR